MIKCKLDREKGTVIVTAKGKGENLTAETLCLIQQVYRGIREANPEAASIYRRAVIGSLLDPKSPVWGKEGEIK